MSVKNSNRLPVVYLISLNELTVFRFLLLLAFTKNVKVLRIAPFMLLAKGALTRLVAWGIRTGRTEYAVNLAPELLHHWNFERRFYFQGIFEKYEPWQNRYYGFDSADIQADKTYGYALKQMTCSYTFWKVIEVFLVDAILKKDASVDYRIHGMLEDTKALGRELFGPSFANDISVLRYPRFVIHGVLSALALVYSVGWLTKRIRPVVNQTKIALMFDLLKDGRENELLKEISDVGSCVLIDRSPGVPGREIIPDEIQSIRHRKTDGLFPVTSLGSSFKLAIVDVAQIAYRYWQLPPALFFEMLSLPFKRLQVRGLLNRYLPDTYIGRDEYNVDHVMRRMELHERGVKSIGLSNALFPCFSLLAPNARYVSYDIYYLYAAPLFTQYLDTWAPDMEIKTLGGYSLPREKMQFQFGAQGEGILFTMRVAWNQPEMVQMVRAVAKAFPDRTIYLQFKNKFVGKEDTERLKKECGEGIPNFVFTTDDVYDLLKTAKYHISDISTFVAEAIRIGTVTIVADILEMEFNCFRLFPDLCVTSAEALTEKLQALESGDTSYPHDAYLKLLGCEVGEVGYDVLRRDLNLAPKAL